MVAQVEIIREEELAGGWTFAVQVLDEDGALHRYTLRLSWADYNLWSPHGADEPGRVAEAVLSFLLSRSPAENLRRSFDASIARRMHADADQRIPSLIGR